MDLILAAQTPEGAFPASKDFSQYNHCWLRDGSFIAYALDRARQSAAAARFHDWVARAINRHADLIGDLLASDGLPDVDRMLPARFDLDGGITEDDWPNFQMDGYGQWLWAVAEHISRGGIVPDVRAVSLVARYVARFWQTPCYDAWEEGRTQLHTSTLVSCWSGLQSAARLLDDPRFAEVADSIRAFVLANCVRDGHLVKQVGSEAVDASLLWAVEPFGFATGELAAQTLETVRRDLLEDGGVIRYRADTYYGGGAWLLLTAWLGWVEARAGDAESASQRWRWVQGQRQPDGALPEQVTVGRTHDWFLEWWRANWGESASPLVWSHAMTVVLGCELLEGIY